MATGKKRKVQIFSPCKALEFEDQALESLFHFMDESAPHSIANGDLSLALLQEQQHSQLHSDYLYDPSPTDVITFPGDPDENLAGEICVSIDMAFSYANTHHLNFSTELILYLIHGWLHLAGFDDRSGADRQVMKQEEQALMHLLETNHQVPLFKYQPNE